MTKKPILAISAEDNLFKNNKIIYKKYASLYPGLSWVPILRNKLNSHFRVLTSDVALNMLEHKIISSHNIFLIQHANDSISMKLLEKGANPLLISCFESPLYAGSFYDSIESYLNKFKNCFLFEGILKLTRCKNINFNISYFPSFIFADLKRNPLAWEKRKFLCGVITNKYVFIGRFPMHLNFTSFFWWLRKVILSLYYKKTFSTFLAPHFYQLQDKRLELICYFMKKNALDLFGKNWHKLRNIPPFWKFSLVPAFKDNPAKPCVNKINTLKKYKFCLCIENVSFPGYVTEKIIDSMVAGVIPVYLGAPDIKKFIPSDCYINVREYRDLDALYNILIYMSPKEASKFLTAGRNFLNSKSGKKFSCEYFADFVGRLALNAYTKK